MNDREFSDIEIFQHSGKGIPLFITGHKNCLPYLIINTYVSLMYEL
jgi:hypothetical protein